MVSSSSSKKVSVSDAMNVFVIGSLGAGKSTILSTLFYPTYEESIGAEDFKPSKSLEGYTKDFTQKFSPELLCLVTDSPGLGDKQIPMNTWLTNYNAQFGQNSRIDLCMIVLEKAARIDTNVVLAFQLLDLTLQGLEADNICVIFNKADEEEDDVESVLAYYESAWTQADCENMPSVDELSEDNILILLKQSMGKKTKPLEECKKEATALFKYAQKSICQFVIPKLTNLCGRDNSVEFQKKTFDDLVEKTQDENVRQALDDGQKYYEENMAQMMKFMENQEYQIQLMAEQNQKQMEDAKQARIEAIALQEKMAQQARQDLKEARADAANQQEKMMKLIKPASPKGPQIDLLTKKCMNDHKMTIRHFYPGSRGNRSASGIYCSKCRETVPRGAEFFHCGNDCNYDLCKVCGNSPQACILF